MADNRLSSPVVDPPFLRRTSTGVTVELRAQPRSRRPGLSCSGGSLRAAVTAPADDGKANAAIVDLLATEWRLPRSAFEIVRGGAQRDKVVRIAGEPGLLAGRIVGWMDGGKQAGER